MAGIAVGAAVMRDRVEGQMCSHCMEYAPWIRNGGGSGQYVCKTCHEEAPPSVGGDPAVVSFEEQCATVPATAKVCGLSVGEWLFSGRPQGTGTNRPTRKEMDRRAYIESILLSPAVVDAVREAAGKPYDDMHTSKALQGRLFSLWRTYLEAMVPNDAAVLKTVPVRYARGKTAVFLRALVDAPFGIQRLCHGLVSVSRLAPRAKSKRPRGVEFYHRKQEHRLRKHMRGLIYMPRDFDSYTVQCKRRLCKGISDAHVGAVAALHTILEHLKTVYLSRRGPNGRPRLMKWKEPGNVAVLADVMARSSHAERLARRQELCERYGLQRHNIDIVGTSRWFTQLSV